MKFYLASRFENQEKLKKVRLKLESMGHTITSRWLDVDIDYIKAEATIDDADIYAERDLEDIEAADAVVFDYTVDMTGARGGVYVEHGYTLGLNRSPDLPCWTIFNIGQRPTLFHNLKRGEIIYFNEWNEFFDYLNSLGRVS